MSPSSSHTSDLRHAAALSCPPKDATRTPEERFEHWLDRELEKLELRFHSFTTRDSLKRSLRANRR